MWVIIFFEAKILGKRYFYDALEFPSHLIKNDEKIIRFYASVVNFDLPNSARWAYKSLWYRVFPSFSQPHDFWDMAEKIFETQIFFKRLFLTRF